MTLMQMSFLKEEQFQKIQWNSYFKFHRVNKLRNKTWRDKESIVDPLETFKNLSLKSKIKMMIWVIAVKLHLLQIPSHQNILRTMIEFTFLKESMGQVDLSKAKDTFFLLWSSEQCVALLTSPIQIISN